MAVLIYEYADQGQARTGEPMAGQISGVLATDALGLPIKSINPVVGTAIDVQMTGKTRLVKLVTDAATQIRYRIRPIGEMHLPVTTPSASAFTPTPNHPTVAASQSVVEVMPRGGAIISIAAF